jgi:hypothetical protein
MQHQKRPSVERVEVMSTLIELIGIASHRAGLLEVRCTPAGCTLY